MRKPLFTIALLLLHQISFSQSSLIQVTNDGLNSSPKISGVEIVYIKSDSSFIQEKQEVYYWNGTVNLNVSNDTLRNNRPHISANNIYWTSYHKNTSHTELHLYNGLEDTVLETSYKFNLNNYNYDVEGDRVVWIKDGWPDSVMQFNGQTTSLLSPIDATSGSKFSPRISEGKTVWHEDVKNDSAHIFMYNGTQEIQLSNYSGIYPSIYKEQIAWQGPNYPTPSGVLINDAIRYFDGDTVIRISIDNNRSFKPKVSNLGILFEDQKGIFDRSLQFYNGDTTMKLSHPLSHVPASDISNFGIVWVEEGFDQDRWVYFYNGQTKYNLTNIFSLPYKVSQVNFESMALDSNHLTFGMNGNIYYANLANVISVEERKLSKLINFYPNPAKEYINVKTNALRIIEGIIINIKGRKIMQLQTEVEQIDISELNNGIYFIQLRTNKGIITKKFIKY